MSVSSSSSSSSLPVASVVRPVLPVLSEALCQAALQRPHDVVAFLGQFLLRHVESHRSRVQCEQDAKERVRKLEILHAQEEAKRVEEHKRAAHEAYLRHAYETFVKQLQATPLSADPAVGLSTAELIRAALVGLADQVKASAAYSAVLSEDAQQIDYITWSGEGADMRGRRLQRGEGATFQLFPEEEEEEEEPEQEEENEDEDDGKKEERRRKAEEKRRQKAQEIKSVVVPDVMLYSEKIRFFGLPKLGGFAAVRVRFDSALHEEAIQIAAERDAPKSSSAEDEQQEEKEDADEDEDNTENSEDSDSQFKGKGDKKKKKKKKKVKEESEEERAEREAKEKAEADKAAAWARLSEEEKARALEEEALRKLLDGVPLKRKQFALCFDTLGQNRPFTTQELERIVECARIIQSLLESFDRKLFALEMQRRAALLATAKMVLKKKEESKLRKEFSTSLGQPKDSVDVQFALHAHILTLLKDAILTFQHVHIFKGPLAIMQAAQLLLGYQLSKKQNDLWSSLRQNIGEEFFQKLVSYKPREEDGVDIEAIAKLIPEEEFAYDEVKASNYPLAEMMALVRDAISIKQLVREEKAKAEEEARLKKEEEERKAAEKAAKAERKRQKELEAQRKAAEEASKAKEEQDEASGSEAEEEAEE